MSSRAVGNAYAACGIDRTFHDFCFDVYNSFKDDAVIMDAEQRQKAKNYLPGMYYSLHDATKFIQVERFPTTLLEIQEEVKYWKGPLGFSPKWNYAHFLLSPDKIPPGSMTMQEEMGRRQIPPYQPPIAR